MKQAVEVLLPLWTEIDTDDALELLGPNTVDSRVRSFAVKQLRRADDDVRALTHARILHLRGRRQELTLYLLQLVQALKFESTSSDPRASRSAATAISHEDSGLADFLIERAVKNPVLGNRFHWYLMVEVEDKVTGKMFGRVAYKFQEQISKVGKRTSIGVYELYRRSI